MNQLICMNKADLRIELGRLRHERHAIDYELQRVESQLNTLKTRKHLNTHQIRALEKQLSHTDGAAICLPGQKVFDAGDLVAANKDEVLASAVPFLDIWPLAAVTVLISMAAVWIWLF